MLKYSWLRRTPEIYDLWADIRLYWKALDYYERNWPQIYPFGGQEISGPIKLYQYELSTIRKADYED